MGPSAAADNEMTVNTDPVAHGFWGLPFTNIRGWAGPPDLRGSKPAALIPLFQVP